MTPPDLTPEQVIITLVGGPFDGDTVKFRPTQTDLILPEHADGPMHRYAMAADGRAHYQGEVVDLARPAPSHDVYTHSECFFTYCPNPETCDPGCVHRREAPVDPA